MATISVRLRLYGLGLVFLFGAGCISPMKFQGRVIERSKQKPPIWLTLSTDQWHESGDYLAMVSVKDYVAYLPLGIRQAQIYSLQHGRDLLHRALLARVREQAQRVSLALDSQKLSKINLLASQVVGSIPNTAFRTVDMYFETYAPSDGMTDQSEIVDQDGQIDREEGYSSVFVLTYIEKKMFEESVKIFGTTLSRSSLEYLAKLAW